MVPIMYEWGEVKTVPRNKIAITIYSWTVWLVSSTPKGFQTVYEGKFILSGQNKNYESRNRISSLSKSVKNISLQEQTQFRVSSKQLLKIILLELSNERNDCQYNKFEEYHILHMRIQLINFPEHYSTLLSLADKDFVG